MRRATCLGPASLVTAWLGALALLVAGCSLTGDANPSVSSTPPAQPAAGGATTAADAGPQGAGPASVGPELLSSGSSPRTTLRFALIEGSTATVAVTTDAAVVEGTGALARTIDTPPVTQTIAYRVGAVSGDGADVDFRVIDVAVDAGGTDLDPSQVLTLTQALQPAEGITGSGHLGVTGRFSGVRLDLPPDLPATVRADIAALPEQIAQLQPVLPTLPVGVGGSWRTTGTSTVAGVTVEQSSTYTVTALRGSTVTYRSSFAATGRRQRLPSDRLAPGAVAELVSSQVSGEGEGTIDLDSLAQTASIDATARQALMLDTPSTEPRRVDQRVEVATEVQAVTAG